MATSATTSKCFMCEKEVVLNSGSIICQSCEREYAYCYQCGEKPRNVPYKLCTDCYDQGRSQRPTPRPVSGQRLCLQALDKKKMEYKKAYGLFKEKWVKGSPPKPETILAISNQPLFQTFQSYAKQLRKKDADSTTDYFFHGTSLLCELSVTNSVCTDDKCGVCGIVQRGFDPALRGTNIPRFKRYGLGFYLAPNSSKCHDYTQGVDEYGLRAQLLCLVACGTKFETTSDHTTLTNPPRFCDSVHGRSGGSLNYDEMVVYNCEAIYPEFVVLYRHNGVHKIAQ